MKYSPQDFENSKAITSKIINEVEKVIIGKKSVIELVLCSWIAGGHVLLEDVPGIGKTTLIKALAKSATCIFNRIQFTPDLLPSDILGVSLLELGKTEFTFKEGPIFTDIFLADEINRTSPRTQSALLEAMEENQITIDGNTYQLNENFFVLATQNPIEYEGTFPLPEAQMDRFLMRLTIGYPSFEDELELINETRGKNQLSLVTEVVNNTDIKTLREMAKDVYVKPALLQYVLRLVEATRNNPKVRLGISPRGALNFIQAAKAYALIKGRDYCIPDDFTTLIDPVLTHRVVLHNSFRSDRKAAYDVLDEIISTIDIPLNG